MMRRKFFLSFTIGALLAGAAFSCPAWADDGPPKPIKLGLDVAKAMAEQKDVGEGLKAVAKDELSNWMWDSIGGYEKLIFQNSEAEIPAAKDKIKKIAETVQAIETFAIAVTEGKYDEAAFTAIDQAVGAIDHPLVSVTWAMCKLTYESHKQVKDSQASLEIETLYGIMSNDRRMMGVVSGEDQPPTIPENAQMADHFYEKYVMTNDGTRQMLKSYVTKVLGDQWPEQSWSDYIQGWMALGSGVDTARSSEIEAMDTEWRQKARTWISRLIKDVNKQARVAWGETRVRQQLAEFKKFSDRVSMFYSGDFERMLSEFNAIKAYQKSRDKDAALVGESGKVLSDLTAKVAAAKGPDVKLVSVWQQTVEEWQLKLLGASSRMQILREDGLVKSLSQERQKWMALGDRISAFAASKEDAAVRDVPVEVQQEYAERSQGWQNWWWSNFGTQVQARAQSYYASLFAPHLKPFDGISFVKKVGERTLNGDPDQIVAVMMDALNSGDLNGAKAILDFWAADVSAAINAYYKEVAEIINKNSGEPSELTNANIALQAASKEYQKFADDAYQRTLPIGERMAVVIRRHCGWMGCNLGGIEADPEYQSLSAQHRAITDSVTAFAQSRVTPLQQKYDIEYYAWPVATRMPWEVHARMAAATSAPYIEKLTELKEAYEAFSGLAASYKGLRSEYLGRIAYIKDNLPMEGAAHDAWAKETLDRVNSNQHTFFVPDKESKETALVHSLPFIFFGMAQQIREGIIDESGALDQLAAFESTKKAWEAIFREFEQMPPLDNADANAIRVLVDPDFDLKPDMDAIKALIVKLRGFMSDVPPKLKQAAQLSSTDRQNREKDADALDMRGRQLVKFFGEMKGKGLLKVEHDIMVVLPVTGEEGMVIAEKPLRHYMSRQELLSLAEPVRAAWEACPAAGFARTYAPGYVAKFMDILSLVDVPAAREENFIDPNNQVQYKSDLVNALKIIKGVKVPDSDYEKKMARVAALVPGIMRVMSASQTKRDEAQARMLNMTLEDYYKKVRGKLPQDEYRLGENVIERTKDPSLQHDLGKVYVEIIELVQKTHDSLLDHLNKQAQDKVAAENAAREKERQRQLEEENQKKAEEMQRQNDPASFYGWRLMDPRVNSYSLSGAHGDVVVKKSDLANGQLELSARLTNIDNIEKILISVDNGRTFVELPVSQDIRYSFTPILNRRYVPVLDVRSKEYTSAKIMFAPNVNSLSVQDEDFYKMVMDAVTALSNAYERQDIGSFSRLIARDYLGNKAYLEEGVRFDFDLFTDIRLKIYINRIEQNRGVYVAETKWDKAQVPRKTGQTQKTTGRTTITFVMEDSVLKIQNLRGDLLYATLSPEIAQSSGLSQAKVDEIRTAHDDRNPVQPGAGTTEDSGGVTGSSSALTVQNSGSVSMPPFPGAGFDFSSNTGNLLSTDPNSDVTLEGNQFIDGQFQQITDGSTFDTLTIAPSGGYVASGIILAVGDVFAFITNEGYYGKLEILSATLNTSVSFKFVVQTDGSRNVST